MDEVFYFVIFVCESWSRISIVRKELIIRLSCSVVGQLLRTSRKSLLCGCTKDEREESLPSMWLCRQKFVAQIFCQSVFLSPHQTSR